MAQQTKRAAPPEHLLPGEMATNARRLIEVRWIAGVLVVAATVFCRLVLRLPLPVLELAGSGLFILTYNGVLAWQAAAARALPPGPTRARRERNVVLAQVALDWLSLGAFLHLTGGISSPAMLFLLIHMLMVAILLPDQPPFLWMVVGLAVLAAVSLLEASGLLPHYAVIPGLPADLHTNGMFIAAELVFFAATAFVLVYLVAPVVARLRERERQVAALLQAMQAVTSTLSLPEVMDRLAESAAQALSIPAASIRLLDESGERLTMTAAYGLSRDYLGKGPVEVARSLLDEEALRGRPVLIRDASSDPRMQYPRELADEGIASVLVAPIIGQSGPLGVLRVYSRAQGQLTEADAAFVMAIARQSAAALENALAHEALRRADEARSRFIRIVTHELRAPVGAAQSLLRTVLRGLAGEINPQQTDILGRASRRLDTLLELVNDLLALAASKTPEMQAAAGPQPLQTALNRILERWRTQAAEKGVALHSELLPGEVAVVATEEGLLRILDNLVGNAVKYTPSGGSVTVRLGERAGSAVITVADTGIGIPAADLPCLWDEFYRASNVRGGDMPGTGLGLSIVRQLVEQFGGRVGVQSVEGEGTTFRVTLPVSPPDAV